VCVCVCVCALCVCGRAFISVCLCVCVNAYMDLSACVCLCVCVWCIPIDCRPDTHQWRNQHRRQKGDHAAEFSTTSPYSLSQSGRVRYHMGRSRAFTHLSPGGMLWLCLTHAL